MCIPTRIQIRSATSADATAIDALQARALKAQSGDDQATGVAAFIEQTDLLDPCALANGHYAVADFGGFILACGGWTANPAQDVAVVLGVFVDADFASTGLGTRILQALEVDIAACGLDTLRAKSTYSGMPFYQRMGFRPVSLVSDRLPSGIAVHGVEMIKVLSGDRSLAA
jgi:GNAT superfamily N-acetyltransferase